MDKNRFDALARLLGTSRSRRATLGALLGGAMLGVGIDAEAKRRNKNKNKNKQRRRRNRNQAAQTCFGTKTCDFPSDGQSFRECNLAGADLPSCDGCDFRRANLADTDFYGHRFQGVSFRQANLSSADMRGADVSGSSFRDACLVGASLLDANTNGASFRGALFCNTILPDGTIANDDCGRLTECCPNCLPVGAACGGTIPGSCCDSDCINGVCQVECVKDSDCGFDFFCCGNNCVTFCCDGSQCPQGICVDGNCAECVKDSDCPEDFVCCAGACLQCCDNEDCPFDETCIEGICVFNGS